jgi:O-antigen ligase
MRALIAGTVLLMLAAVGSLFASPLPWNSLLPSAQVLLGGALVLGAARLSPHPRSAHLVTGALIAAGWFLVLLSLVGTDWPTHKLPWLAPVYRSLPRLWSLPFPGIHDGFQPNQIGGMVAVSFAFAAGIALIGSRRSWPGPSLWYPTALLAFLSLPTVVLTGSRVGLAGAGLALFVLLAVRWRQVLWVVPLALATALPAALVWADLPARVAGLFLRDETLDTKLVARVDIWLSALRGIEDHAITGIGLGVFNDVVPVRYPYESVGLSYSVSQAHNVLLDTALTMGLPALVGLLLVLTGMAVLGRAGLSASHHRRPLAAAVLAATTSYLAFGMTDGISFSSPGSLIFWTMIILLALTAPSSNQR